MSHYSNGNRVSLSSSSSGIGFTGLLQVAFIILRLCHVIDWSWWWVLSPTWISVLFAIGILVCSIVFISIGNRKR